MDVFHSLKYLGMGLLCLMNSTAFALEPLSKSTQSSGGSYTVELIAPNPIPINQVCALRFKVVDSQGQLPMEDLNFLARAWMPAHGHGTALQPRFSMLENGEILGEGFLFQMEGRWELQVSLLTQGALEKASFILDLNYE